MTALESSTLRFGQNQPSIGKPGGQPVSPLQLGSASAFSYPESQYLPPGQGSWKSQLPPGHPGQLPERGSPLEETYMLPGHCPYAGGGFGQGTATCPTVHRQLLELLLCGSYTPGSPVGPQTPQGREGDWKHPPPRSGSTSPGASPLASPSSGTSGDPPLPLTGIPHSVAGLTCAPAHGAGGLAHPGGSTFVAGHAAGGAMETATATFGPCSLAPPPVDLPDQFGTPPLPAPKREWSGPILDTSVPVKKLRRLVSNRASAKRSRQRKQERLEELELLTARLLAEQRELKKGLDKAMEQLRLEEEQNKALRKRAAEARALQPAALSQRKPPPAGTPASQARGGHAKPPGNFKQNPKQVVPDRNSTAQSKILTNATQAVSQPMVQDDCKPEAGLQNQASVSSIQLERPSEPDTATTVEGSPNSDGSSHVGQLEMPEVRDCLPDFHEVMMMFDVVS